MIFFGTQPTFTQVPPSRPDSMSTVRAPYSAARCAAASPPLPPPITTRSNASAMSAMLYEPRARRTLGAVGYNASLRGARMDNPLLGEHALPRFVQIRPEHVEPAVRELLERNRARIEELAALETPTFATLIEPLEELQHGLTRAWSPVSHLNAVVNSEALRAGYNACLPLLSAYHTDLAQSEPLFRAYRTIAERDAAELGPVEQRVIEHAVRDFRLAGVGLPEERKRRFKTVMQELTQLQAKFEENVLDATNAWSW